MSLLFILYCPRQGFLASRKKKHAGRPSLLVFPRLIRVKEPRSPSSFPPRQRTVPGPKAGAKISHFFIPIQTFLQLFCKKICPGNPTTWKTTGNRSVFSPAGHVHPGGVLRIPATKRPPPTRAPRKSSPPRWKTGTRNPWTQNHRRAIMRKPRFLPPEIPSGHAPRPPPRKARPVRAQYMPKAYGRVMNASPT